MGRTHDKELLGAARKGHNPRVERMIRQGANVNAEGDSGSTPLSEAASQGHLDVIRTLLNAGADPNQGESLVAALHNSSKQGHAEIVRLLLARGADPDCFRAAWTPLDIAIFLGHEEIAIMLIDAGATTDRGGYHGDESMYKVARRYRRERVAKYLQSKGLHR